MKIWLTNTDEDDLMWIERNVLANAASLQKALMEIRWVGFFDPVTEDVIGLEFIGQKLGNEFEIFKVLAPFVVPGSFIEYQSEDGVGDLTHEKWSFEQDAFVWTATSADGQILATKRYSMKGATEMENTENMVAVVGENPIPAIVAAEDKVPIEVIEEPTAPELNIAEEEPKPLTPEQIAYHQKQLRIKALKVAKMHKDAGIRHMKSKAAKVARRKNRLH